MCTKHVYFTKRSRATKHELSRATEPEPLLPLVSGMYPATSSFDLLRPEYVTSLGFNDSLIHGFVLTTMDPFLRNLTMTYCRDSREIVSEHEPVRRPVCKIPCKCFTTKETMYNYC